MRSLFAILFAALLLGTSSAVSAKHRAEVKVQINHETPYKGIKIKFVDLIEDSRCPTDTTCVWAGNAKISVQLSKNGKKKILEMNSGMSPKTVQFEGYDITLTKLTPAPASNIRIRKDGYVATFSLVKRP